MDYIEAPRKSRLAVLGEPFPRSLRVRAVDLPDGRWIVATDVVLHVGCASQSSGLLRLRRWAGWQELVRADCLNVAERREALLVSPSGFERVREQVRARGYTPAPAKRAKPFRPLSGQPEGSSEWYDEAAGECERRAARSMPGGERRANLLESAARFRADAAHLRDAIKPLENQAPGNFAHSSVEDENRHLRAQVAELRLRLEAVFRALQPTRGFETD